MTNLKSNDPIKTENENIDMVKKYIYILWSWNLDRNRTMTFQTNNWDG